AGYIYPLEQFNEVLNELIQETYNHVRLRDGKVEDIISPNRTSQDIQAVRLKQKMMDNYRKVTTFNQQITEKEESIQRIENEAYLRALKFRTLTTLSIGLGILSIYGVAQYFGINLPLMRVGA
ncbi:MAG: hypothetical protein ACPIA3_03850, partial [Pseudomonadales bacterium]